jgi:hypothetical protein
MNLLGLKHKHFDVKKTSGLGKLPLDGIVQKRYDGGKI